MIQKYTYRQKRVDEKRVPHKKRVSSPPPPPPSSADEKDPRISKRKTKMQQKNVEEEKKKWLKKGSTRRVSYPHPPTHPSTILIYPPRFLSRTRVAYVQVTVMSEACAERCGLTPKIDTRFAGRAVGVGFARILGKIHDANIR